MVLIPKKKDALCLGDYRPISLTYNVAKLFSKLLANRLIPFLNQLVSRSQSPCIKRRSLQDNFSFHTKSGQSSAQSKKKLALFMKLDIAKAFDSVRWDFL
jgi:hypothetical protein